MAEEGAGRADAGRAGRGGEEPAGPRDPAPQPPIRPSMLHPRVRSFSLLAGDRIFFSTLPTSDWTYFHLAPIRFAFDQFQMSIQQDPTGWQTAEHTIAVMKLNLYAGHGLVSYGNRKIEDPDRDLWAICVVERDIPLSLARSRCYLYYRAVAFLLGDDTFFSFLENREPPINRNSIFATLLRLETMLDASPELHRLSVPLISCESFFSKIYPKHEAHPSRVLSDALKQVRKDEERQRAEVLARQHAERRAAQRGGARREQQPVEQMREAADMHMQVANPPADPVAPPGDAPPPPGREPFAPAAPEGPAAALPGQQAHGGYENQILEDSNDEFDDDGLPGADPDSSSSDDSDASDYPAAPGDADAAGLDDAGAADADGASSFSDTTSGPGGAGGAQEGATGTADAQGGAFDSDSWGQSGDEASDSRKAQTAIVAAAFGDAHAVAPARSSHLARSTHATHSARGPRDARDPRVSRDSRKSGGVGDLDGLSESPIAAYPTVSQDSSDFGGLPGPAGSRERRAGGAGGYPGGGSSSSTDSSNPPGAMGTPVGGSPPGSSSQSGIVDHGAGHRRTDSEEDFRGEAEREARRTPAHPSPDGMPYYMYRFTHSDVEFILENCLIALFVDDQLYHIYDSNTITDEFDAAGNYRPIRGGADRRTRLERKLRQAGHSMDGLDQRVLTQELVAEMLCTSTLDPADLIIISSLLTNNAFFDSTGTMPEAAVVLAPAGPGAPGLLFPQQDDIPEAAQPASPPWAFTFQNGQQRYGKDLEVYLRIKNKSKQSICLFRRFRGPADTERSDMPVRFSACIIVPLGAPLLAVRRRVYSDIPERFQTDLVKILHSLVGRVMAEAVRDMYVRAQSAYYDPLSFGLRLLRTKYPGLLYLSFGNRSWGYTVAPSVLTYERYACSRAYLESREIRRAYRRNGGGRGADAENWACQADDEEQWPSLGELGDLAGLFAPSQLAAEDSVLMEDDQESDDRPSDRGSDLPVQFWGAPTTSDYYSESNRAPHSVGGGRRVGRGAAGRRAARPADRAARGGADPGPGLDAAPDPAPADPLSGYSHANRERICDLIQRLRRVEGKYRDAATEAACLAELSARCLQAGYLFYYERRENALRVYWLFFFDPEGGFTPSPAALLSPSSGGVLAASSPESRAPPRESAESEAQRLGYRCVLDGVLPAEEQEDRMRPWQGWFLAPQVSRASMLAAAKPERHHPEQHWQGFRPQKLSRDHGYLFTDTFWGALTLKHRKALEAMQDQSQRLYRRADLFELTASFLPVVSIEDALSMMVRVFWDTVRRMRTPGF